MYLKKNYFFEFHLCNVFSGLGNKPARSTELQVLAETEHPTGRCGECTFAQ